MNKLSLEVVLLKARRKGNHKLEQSIMQVTGVGVPPGEIIPGSELPVKTRSNSLNLQISTGTFIEPENRRSGLYGALALAVELREFLQGKGFDGWIYTDKSKAFRTEHVPFHNEILIWEPFPAKIKLLTLVDQPPH